MRHGICSPALKGEFRLFHPYRGEPERSATMSVAKIIEIYATSSKSFEDAIQQGIARAAKTVDNISGAWVNEQKVDIENGKISQYRVNLKVTFIMND
jgi:hypothetical protein